MSGRIAHRPNYRLSRHFAQSPRVSRKDYLRTRWTYRQQRQQFEQHPLGYSLSLLPFGYRLMQGVARL
jgi:hypothetical protein